MGGRGDIFVWLEWGKWSKWSVSGVKWNVE